MPVQKHPLNTVLLVGRVCKPPVMSHSRNGKPMLTVVLSVDRPENVPQKVVTEDGHVHTEPDYPVVVISGDIARELAGKVLVGVNLFVSGIFQTRNYTDNSVKPPRPRVAMEVLSNNVRVLETPADMARATSTIAQAQSAAETLRIGVSAGDPRQTARNARKRQRKQRVRERAVASAPSAPNPTTSTSGASQ
jgi:single-stranded DNA-binding protein